MRERDIFIEVLQRTDPAQRLEYLDRLCAEDDALRQRVMQLLVEHERNESFILDAAPPVGGVGDVGEAAQATLDFPMAEAVGTQVGPYKLLERIGEGGMGRVWLAKQTEPVKRLVAIKFIKAGMDSKQVLARFEAERQALALMDHPNIAKVLDAGTTTHEGTDVERPYFVMELVKGTPITTYCDAKHLSVRQRLELFGDVCRAVQHAHQKGIIHRDLKPSNILIAPYDGRPVVKVIDFGVAKATGQQLTEATLVTGFGAIVGTPEYMSPEQAETNNQDIDTRSDIYSLGVLLYELLTGSTPVTKQRLKAVALLEILRVIREEEPTKPSTKLSTAEGLPALAANRGTVPAQLSKLLRGELDWIVMKALEKDRTRRYASAGDLAQDVQRHLADEPVQACPPSLAYLLRKFGRRHKRTVLAGSALVLTMAGGIVGTTVGMVRAERRAAGEQQAKDIAEKRLAQFEQGVDAIGALFEDIDPFAEEKEGRPLRAILGDRLDRIAAELEGDTLGDPLIVARLQVRLGRTYLGLGNGVKAAPLFTRASAIYTTERGPDDPSTLATQALVASARFEAGQRVEAIALFEQVRDAQVRTLGRDHAETLLTLYHLGSAYRYAGRPKEAIVLLEEVREARKAQLGPSHDQTLAVMQKLASAYMAAERRADAVKLSQEVLRERQGKHAADHPYVIAAMNELAYAYQYAFRMKDALTLLEQARDISVLKLGESHPLTLSILNNLSHMYRAYKRTPEAIALLDQVLQRRLLTTGAHHPATLAVVYQLALAHEDTGASAKAVALYRQAATGIERLHFAHGDADAVVYHLCQCLEKEKQYEEAESWRRKWLATVEKKEPGSKVQVEALAGLGVNLLRQKKYDAAEPILLQGYRGVAHAARVVPKKRQGFTTTDLREEALRNLIDLYDGWGQPAKAAEWRAELSAYTANDPAPPKP